MSCSCTLHSALMERPSHLPVSMNHTWQSDRESRGSTCTGAAGHVRFDASMGQCAKVVVRVIRSRAPPKTQAPSRTHPTQHCAHLVDGRVTVRNASATGSAITHTSTHSHIPPPLPTVLSTKRTARTFVAGRVTVRSASAAGRRAHHQCGTQAPMRATLPIPTSTRHTARILVGGHVTVRNASAAGPTNAHEAQCPTHTPNSIRNKQISTLRAPLWMAA